MICILIKNDFIFLYLFIKININMLSCENETIKNKGFGAGGSNTNKNGLPYELITDLHTEYKILNKNKNSIEIKFNKSDKKKYVKSDKSKFFKYMKKNINNEIPKAHGCKQPDECYIDEIDKVIFILEKKFQKVGGSVCEKIQTPDFKKWQYSRTFLEYEIVYIYCLSDWFKENCKAELEYLEHKKVPYFWGSDTKYKEDIINFIINYK